MAIGKRLYVGNLSYNTTETSLRTAFESDGRTVVEVKIVTDRETGQPIFGMEERPVPQSQVPGEHTSATQPFPLKPPPLSIISFDRKNLYDRTPEHARFCRDLLEKQELVSQGPYTPMPPKGNALTFPSTLGGGNWGGLSFNPALGYLFANVMNLGQWGHMEARMDGKTGSITYRKSAAAGGAYGASWPAR